MTNTYVFIRSGYESDAYLVKAESETEAKGKLYDETPTGIKPKYKGTVDQLMGSDEVNKIV